LRARTIKAIILKLVKENGKIYIGLKDLTIEITEEDVKKEIEQSSTLKNYIERWLDILENNNITLKEVPNATNPFINYLLQLV
jgi:hypothetical protein